MVTSISSNYAPASCSSSNIDSDTLMPMTHAAETGGVINRLVIILAPVFRTICVWRENSWRWK